MNQSVRCQRFAAIQLESRAIEPADLASGFLDNQDPGRRIPRVEVKFPEAIEAATGDTAQVERCRPGTADAMSPQRDLVVEENVRILVAFMTRESCGHQAFFQLRDFRNLDRLAIQLRAFPLFCGEKFVPRGIIDNAGYPSFFISQAVL